MLIIPYQTRFTARSLPVVTIALIVINALVYFAFQAGDRQALQKAAAYYFSSQLPSIELPRYAAALEKRGDPQAVDVQRALNAPPPARGAQAVLAAMQRDREFMRDLREGRVVPPGDPLHDAWQEQRQRFDGLLKAVFTERYALQPGGSWFALLTYQFLHGDAMHWFGNMLVLLLAGPFAEAALGRARFLLAYLFSGACAGALFLGLNGQMLVGASGAIAGAMAMVAVLYGARKVPVFYWLFVYFNTARVPALLLLPVWLIIEAAQWLLAPGSRVAYSAHIGGFIAGAAAAWLLKSTDRSRVEQVLDEQFADEHRGQRTSTLLEQAQQAAARLDTQRAARAYSQLLADDPGNATYAIAYFNMALLGRQPATIVDAAQRVLSIRERTARARLRAAYLQMSQPQVLASLSVEDQLRLVRRLVAAREDAAALKVLDGLTANETVRHAHAPQLTECLLGLVAAYSRLGLHAEAEQMQLRLSTQFPSNAVAGSAAAVAVESESMRGAPSILKGASKIDIDLGSDLQPRF